MHDKDRFPQLVTFEHFSDNSHNTTNNRLFKIRLLLDELLGNFQQIYITESDVVFDESLITFRGRLIFKHYIPDKSNEHASKLYEPCSPNSYTCNIQVYVEK